MANYVFNSSSSGERYNAKCLNVSDDSEWTPSAAEYPQDGTIDLSGGTSGRYLDTQWVAPQDTEWTMSFIYNVVMGVSYDMYSIHYKGNQTCDIYLGSSTVPLVLSEEDKPYTPPTGTWKIYEEPPAIIIPDDTTIQMIEIQNGYCEFDEGGSCTTPSLISSTITVSYTTITYNWVVIGATIDGSNTEDYIVVTTPAGNIDVTYTVQLTATIDGVEYYIENDYTQVKTLAPIRITGISQDVSGSCDPNPPVEPPYDPGIYDGTITDDSTSATFTDLTGGDWNIETTVPIQNSSSSFIVGTTEAFDIGVENTWAFNAEILSGSLTIQSYYQGGGGDTAVNQLIVEGYNEVKFTTQVSFADIYFLPTAGDDFNINFTDISIVKGE